MDTKRRGRRWIGSLHCSVLRITCFSCNFTGSLRTFGGIRTDDETCRLITRESLERASIRILARRYEKSRDTIMKIIRRVVEGLPDSAAIAQKFCPLWSGILVFDGKVIRVYDKLSAKLKPGTLTEDEEHWLHKMRWLCGVDHATGDLPHYELADSENKIDLIMYFQTLKSLHYPLKGLVCDGNPLIPEAARFVYGKGIVLQRCTRHFLEDLRRLLPAEEDDPATRAKLEELITGIKQVIAADTLAAAVAANWSLQQISSHPIARMIMKQFEQTKSDLVAHLLHPELHLPHTTNDIENLFKQLMLRLKSLGRFFHYRYAREYLKAWALLRRFTPFTDCRRKRKHRNGKAPLTLAGCEIKNIDPLKLQN